MLFDLYYGIPTNKITKKPGWEARFVKKLLKIINDYKGDAAIEEYEIIAEHIDSITEDAEPDNEAAKRIIHEWIDSEHGDGLEGLIATVISGQYLESLPDGSWCWINAPVSENGVLGLRNILPQNEGNLMMPGQTFSAFIEEWLTPLSDKTIARNTRNEIGWIFPPTQNNKNLGIKTDA